MTAPLAAGAPPGTTRQEFSIRLMIMSTATTDGGTA